MALDSLLAQVQAATLSPQVIKASGAGKAYQSVAQSCALTIQDGSDYLRNILMISMTAQGVAISLYVATGLPKYKQAIEVAQNMVTAAATAFSTISGDAITVASTFPTS